MGTNSKLHCALFSARLSVSGAMAADVTVDAGAKLPENQRLRGEFRMEFTDPSEETLLWDTVSGAGFPCTGPHRRNGTSFQRLQPAHS